MRYLLVLIIVVVPVYAQCTLRPRVVYTSYATTYVAPVVAYAPSYDYVYVPKAIAVEVQRNHYYSIDPYAQQNLLADAIVGRLLRMQSEGRVPRIGDRYAEPPASYTSPTPKTDAGRTGAQELRAGVHQNPELLKVVTDSCAKCHSPGMKQTALLTNDGKLADIPAGKAWEAFGLVNSGEMPKAAKSLTDDQVKLFYEWAKNARK